jgi:hypothetical protein
MKYTTGAKLNEKDYRDIPLAKVQAPVELPKKYLTDLSIIPVLNQRGLGACVGHAIATALTYINYQETKQVEYLSPRFIYGLAKQLDGRPDEEGTQPRIGAKITTDNGCALDKDLPNDTFLTHRQYISIGLSEALKASSKPFKTKGYAFIPITQNDLKQAIFQNKVITLTIGCGEITTKEIKKGNASGYHYICVYGYETIGTDTIFYYRNSWGDNWGNKGDGKFSFKDFNGFIFDAIAYVDLPNNFIEEAKAGYRYFKGYEIVGLKHELVSILDNIRHEAGFPMVITSGLRTKKENDALKDSASNSGHLRGWEADIACTDSKKRDKLIELSYKYGITRRGIGKGFVHLGIDPTLPQNVMWHYYK